LYLTTAIQELTLVGGGIPKLKEIYNGLVTGKRLIRTSGGGFMEFFKSEYEQQELDGTKSASHLKSTYNALDHYFKGTKPSFNQIDKEFCKSFKKWCEADKNYMVSYISSLIKWIKYVMAKAEEKGLHKNYQYEKFEREAYTVDKVALSYMELDKIAFAVLPEKLSMVRDYFLLSCYTGARISDWSKFQNISKNSKLWYYINKKTKEKATVKITDEIDRILMKYDYNLPAITLNQFTNEDIRKVCKSAGLTYNHTINIIKGGQAVSETAERFTFIASHTGRRTFTTNSITDGMPVHLVMLQTGHKTLTSLESYIKLKELQSTIALLDWKKPEK
jgi:site-specific recombinase XerD